MIVNNPMIIFADTSKDDTLIALIKDTNFVDETTFESRGMQTELLLSKVDELLSKHSLTKKSIKLIAVTNGPGSYTGLRIGLSTFNSMAFALNIPIVAVSATRGNSENISAVSKVSEVSFSHPVMPIYSYPPKITKSSRP